MSNLVLFGIGYEVADESVTYNDYRKEFFIEATKAEKHLREQFKATELSDRSDFDKLVADGRAQIDSAVASVVAMLTEKEIYEYSVDSIKRSVVVPLEKFGNAADEVYAVLDAIDSELRIAEAQRQREIDSASSSWSGGGFGIEGALAGAAQAAMLNVASGAVTMALTSGDAKRARSAHEMRIYKLLNGRATVDSMCTALYEDIFQLVKTFVKILVQDKGENIKVVSDEEILKSKDIFNNIKTGVYNSKPDVEKQMWIKTLTLYPYDTEYFIHLLNTHDEAFDEIKELISWYNLPMDDIADTLLAGKYDFSNITELEEARRQKELLIADLSKFGIKESRLTDDADAKIEEILVQRRTYEDITYDTEEDCGYARELDGRLGAEVEAAAGKNLPELVELYTGMTDCEDAEKYAVICTKNALLLHTLLINAVKGCASAEELTSYKERIEGSKAKEISTPVIKQIDSKIKSINLSGNLNDAKEKLVGSAKDIFGKAKGLFKK